VNPSVVADRCRIERSVDEELIAGRNPKPSSDAGGGGRSALPP
jgi:hypothetical protein